MTLLLSAKNLYKKVKDGDAWITLLADINLEVSAGERVCLVGPSGSGKSSLLTILGALDSDYEGDVRIDRQLLHELSDAELARFRNQFLGFVFQSYNLLAHLSALDNILVPSRFGPSAPDRELAKKALSDVGLEQKGTRRPRALSGGERQRVAIARALYHKPKMMLCDEPTGNLDSATGREILSLFEKLSDDGIALLMASHDTTLAKSAHRVLQLQEGRLV